MSQLQPQHLTLKEVKAACRKALEDGLLLALLTDPTSESFDNNFNPDSICLPYKYVRNKKTFYCSIGAALSKISLDKIIKKDLNSYSSLEVLILNQIITVDPSEKDSLEELQELHDSWFLSRLAVFRDVKKHDFLDYFDLL